MRPSRQVNPAQGNRVGNPRRRNTIGSSYRNRDTPNDEAGIDLFLYTNDASRRIGAPRSQEQSPVRPHSPELPPPNITPTPPNDTPMPHPQGLILPLRETRVVDSKSAEEEKGNDEFRWPGDITDYPAEACEELVLPGCEYRAKTIHVGRPKQRFENNQSINVYAIRPAGAKGVEYRIAEGVWSPQEIIEKGSPIKFDDISPSVFFRGMKQAQVELWVKQLLAQVPGQNDTVMKWARGSHLLRTLVWLLKKNSTYFVPWFL
ncbi:hypothetical protein F5X96DRAFT_685244 [Biscogniauxia mediterranea]|nr:hypothetical protein F5X96DRAFT_685244 [Biscogniauxia mediterranea]